MMKEKSMSCEWMYEDKELQEEFHRSYVMKIMTQCWALDEIQSQEEAESLEDEIWKDYERWAWNHLENDKETQYG